MGAHFPRLIIALPAISMYAFMQAEDGILKKMTNCIVDNTDGSLLILLYMMRTANTLS